MAQEALYIFFLPLLAQGHMLPMVDMAKLFAKRGVKAAIITTPANAARIQFSIDRANDSSHHHIELLQIQFSSSVAGLPEGCENLSAYRTPEINDSFIEALYLLRQPFEQLVRERRPDCIVSDAFYPWTADIAGDFGIPRIIFNGPGYFSLIAIGCIIEQRPHESVKSDTEPFVVPGISHLIEMTKNQLQYILLQMTRPKLMTDMGLAVLKSYGVVVNSFYELEPDYVREIGGLRTWHIGPVSLCNSATIDRVVRGGDNASPGSNENCLNWLDSKKPNSVLYVCFGSLGRFTGAQLREIAVGLENSGHPFIWVVRNDVRHTSEWMPEGFENRITEENKGLIIRGWAPQLLVLNHDSTGGFLTHCGWNSSLEGITAGVPMIAWPLFADQFFNEKFITQVLRIGIGVGIEKCSAMEEERVLVKAEKVEKAVRELMGGGEEAEGMRKRAMEFGFMAIKAVEEGGSSYNSLSNLIEDLIEVKAKKSDV